MALAMNTGTVPVTMFKTQSITNILITPALSSISPAHSSKDGQGMIDFPATIQKSDGLSKLVTTIVSAFTAYYVHLWSSFFPEIPLSPPLPSFDGRAVQYPSVRNLRDYMSWRQVDCESACDNVRILANLVKVTSITSIIQRFGL